MQLDVHISGIQEVKTRTEVKTNKQTQEVKLMTVIQFESEVKPEALLDLYRLIEIDAPLNGVLYSLGKIIRVRQ
jgi:hypothetical protein